MADDLDIKDSERSEQDDLEQTVECHQDGTIVSVASCEIGPDENHSDTSSDTNEYQALPQIRPIGKESPCQTNHK